jgi:predicted GIY-YIG superfamily endonuclease
MVADEAKKYMKRTDFKKGSPYHYRAATQNGWLEDVTQHMPNKYIVWNKEDVHKEALKYQYPSEFYYNSPKAYGTALYRGWYDDVTSHMGKLGSIKERMVYAYEFPDNFVYIGLTYHKDKRNDQHMKSGPVFNHMNETGLQPIRIEISNYIDAQEASQLEISTEKKYRDEGWNILNQARPGVLGGSTPVWTPETVRKESSKYQTVKDFRLGNPKAYNAAQRNGWVPELGLTNTEVRWDYDSVAKIAKKYKTRKEFGDNNPGAYQYALRNKIMDDISKHMDVKQIK